jgi:3-hydroxyisobutyrate dehydrogenase-like beta-hydroxyacid dehydrogenase
MPQDDVNLDLPVTQLVANLENNLMERGHGDEDVSGPASPFTHEIVND